MKVPVDAYIEKRLKQFLDEKVEYERQKGTGASRSAMVETAIREYLLKNYGLQYVIKARRSVHE